MADVDLTSAVRKILVKNWIDMGKVRLQVAGKTVILRGQVRKSGEGHDPVNGLFLEELERQIMAAKGVRFVRWILEDWKQDRGKWVPGED
ncbi:MAG: hypothetical protein MUE73_01670 [Planctomycetes bacterium]|jgi:hypothetical protein|nr:hypothetical protein [Planctomycetota bacterium]